MQLTRRQTAYYEFNRLIGNFQVISEKLPENDSALDDIFNEIDQETEDIFITVSAAIENEETVYGTDENNESYILVPIPDRKPPSRPPSFP